MEEEGKQEETRNEVSEKEQVSKEEEEEEEEEEDEEMKTHESPFPGSRLIITEMILENFKSYAGVKKIGPFHKCFSSVVGPNGSGKSNVIDAMLFVFGKRAKKLRLNKISELIHNSTNYPNLQYAKVSVKFANIVDRPYENDDDEGYDIVPGSELEVSRIAYKGNKSDYFVDGKKHTFTQVAKLLMKRGIDLNNNRFLILQGEVEQISLMKPKAQTQHEDGLLEYLEDIIGSNKYVEEIEQVSKQVEELGEFRSEKLNRVKVVEKEKEGLEDAKNEAEDYIKKDRMLSEKRSYLLQAKLAEGKKELADLKTKLEELNVKIQEEEKSIDGSNGEKKQVENKLSECQKHYEEITKAMKQSKKDFAGFERKDVKYREDLKHAQKAMKELEKTIAKQEKLHEKHKSAAAQAAEESLPELEQEAESLKEQKQRNEEKLEKLYESLQGETGALRVELEAKQQGLAPLSEKVSSAKSKLDVVLTEIELTEQSVNSSKKLLEESQDKLEELEVSIASRPKELAAAERDLENAEEQLGKTIESLEETKQTEKSLEAEVRASRGRTESAKAQLAAASSRGVLLQSLSEAKATQGNPINTATLFGRLGDLGSIDKKYDVAISTACGGLDYLVTETTKGAETCVQYLRQKQLGRATFAILEKLQHHKTKMDREISTPENVPRLFDLIQVNDERFRVAFYHVMRDTLVAKDLDQAVRIAYKGNKCVWRVVTLTGQVIDTSGTMSGGGKRVKRGGMKTFSSKSAASAAASSSSSSEIGLITKDQVIEMERSTKDLHDKLTACRKQVQLLGKEKSQLEKRIAELKLVIPKMQMEIQEMEKQRSQLQENIESLKPKCELSKSEKKRLNELEKQKTQHQDEYDSAKSELGQLEKETSQLHEKIAQVGGAKVEKLKGAIEKLEKSLEKNRKATSKANKDIKSLTAKANKAKAAFEEAVAEMSQAKEHHDKLKSEHSQIEEEALVVLQALEKAKKDEEEAKEQLEEAKRLCLEYKSKTKELQKELVSMKNKRKEFEERDIPQKQTAVDNLEAHLEELLDHYDAMVKSAPQTTAEVFEEEEEDDDDDDDDEMDDDDDEEKDDEHDENEKKKQRQKKTKKTGRDALILDEDQIAQIDFNLTRSEIELLDEEVNKLKKVVNMGAIKEYIEREKEYRSRVEELDEATVKRDKSRERCDELRKKRLTEFMAGFCQITLKLKEMYQMITLGGDAELELVDSCDPFSEGIVFSVRPPKKSWKNISNLSGGEKTLSSLALVFALHHYKPTPLYVMDEIDAALDHRNVSIIGNYIKERTTKNAQFLIISLRSNMFELADRLIGIYKTNDATKSVTINPAKIVKKAAMEASAARQKQQNQRMPLSSIDNQVST